MKTTWNHIVSTTLFFVVCALSIPANAQLETKKIENRAQHLTEQMRNKLSLSDAQLKSVYAINLKYAQENEKIRASNDGQFAKLIKFKSTQDDKSKELKPVLTKKQYKDYEIWMEEIKSQMKEKYKNRLQ
jgi:hypothetical protein